MTLKEFLISRVRLFFILVTLILLATSIMGGIVAPEQDIKYYQLMSPIVIAGLCVLPTCVTYFKKEPTPGQYFLRCGIQLILIEAVVMLFLTPPDGGSVSRPLFYVLIGVTVLMIYAAATALLWLNKYRESRELTEQLKKLQGKK